MNKKSLTVFLALAVIVVSFFGGFYFANYLNLPETDVLQVGEDVYYGNDNMTTANFADISNSDISIHFLELGNKYTGDCTYIKTETCDILIDCGSKSDSVATVANYLSGYITDGTIEYVIVTHAHQDHYAGFATSGKVKGIFDLYECQTIIDFAGTAAGKTETALYQKYDAKLQAEIEAGATHYTALDCINGTSQFDIGGGYSLKILDSFFYHHPDSSNENNNSVCCLVTNNANNYLFTGDLEAEGEEHLITLNSLPQVDLYKAGHHGSKTSSSEDFLQVIKPKVVCVCCCAGSSEYTNTAENQFPTQTFINNVSKWTDKIFVTTLCLDYKNNKFTSFNGNIVFMDVDGENKIWCSNNTTILKETEWFAKNRTWPTT